MSFNQKTVEFVAKMSGKFCFNGRKSQEIPPQKSRISPTVRQDHYDDERNKTVWQYALTNVVSLLIAIRHTHADAKLMEIVMQNVS